MLYAVAKAALRLFEGNARSTPASEEGISDQPEQLIPQEAAMEPSLLDAILAVDHAAQRTFLSSIASTSAANARSFRLCCRAARNLVDNLLTSPVVIRVGGIVGEPAVDGGSEQAKKAWAAAAVTLVDALRATARRWPHRTELQLHLRGMQQVCKECVAASTQASPPRPWLAWPGHMYGTCWPQRRTERVPLVNAGVTPAVQNYLSAI